MSSRLSRRLTVLLCAGLLALIVLVGGMVTLSSGLAFNPQPDPPGKQAFNPQPDPPGKQAFNPQPDPPGKQALITLYAASSNPASSNPAVVIKDSACFLFDGNGSPVLVTQSQAVITSSGNSKFTCRAQVTPSSTAQGAVYWNLANTGYQCNTFVGLTPHWEEVVTPSGQATLTCQFNGSSS